MKSFVARTGPIPPLLTLVFGAIRVPVVVGLVLACVPCAGLADDESGQPGPDVRSDTPATDTAPTDAPAPTSVLAEASAYTAQVCACRNNDACIAALEADGLELVERVWATEAGGALADELNAASAELKTCAPELWATLSAAAEAASSKAAFERYVTLGGPAACDSYVRGGERFELQAVGDEDECVEAMIEVVEVCGEDRAEQVFGCLAEVEADRKDAWLEGVGACAELCF